MRLDPVVMIGTGLMFLSLIMGVIAACFFTATSATPGWDWIGGICFWGFLPVGSLGAIVLVVGLLLSFRKQRE